MNRRSTAPFEPDASAAAACLVLMVKAPVRAKRRLAGEIGAAGAAAAADLLSACALEDMAAWRGPRCYAPAGPADSAWLQARVPSEALTVLQCEGNLGQRINYVNLRLHALGFERQIFIGADCPELDAEYLRGAAAALLEHDAVLGPAADGGVVLMGAARPWPELAGLAWSTARLNAELTALCRARGWSVAALEPRADVDTKADLEAARAALGDDPRAARRSLTRWLAGRVAGP